MRHTRHCTWFFSRAAAPHGKPLGKLAQRLSNGWMDVGQQFRIKAPGRNIEWIRVAVPSRRI